MSNEKVRKLLEEANRVNSIPSILTGNGTKAIALGIVQIQESVAALTKTVNSLKETISTMQIPATNTELTAAVNEMKETLGIFISALESEETKTSEATPISTPGESQGVKS